MLVYSRYRGPSSVLAPAVSQARYGAGKPCTTTKKWLIGERFLPHCLLYCYLRFVGFSAISGIIVGDMYKVVVRARAIRDVVGAPLSQLGGASPDLYLGNDGALGGDGMSGED